MGPQELKIIKGYTKREEISIFQNRCSRWIRDYHKRMSEARKILKNVFIINLGSIIINDEVNADWKQFGISWDINEKKFEYFKLQRLKYNYKLNSDSNCYTSTADAKNPKTSTSWTPSLTPQIEFKKVVKTGIISTINITKQISNIAKIKARPTPASKCPIRISK